MRRTTFTVLALLSAATAASAQQQGAGVGVTLYDTRGNAFGTGANPFPVATVPAPGMGQGLAVYRVMNAASAAAVSVKASAGRVYSFNLCNNTNASRYVRFYNSAAATTGTTPVYAGAITLSAGSCQQYTTNFGLTFSAGISFSVTAANGDADATAPLAGDVSGFIGYL